MKEIFIESFTEAIGENEMSFDIVELSKDKERISRRRKTDVYKAMSRKALSKSIDGICFDNLHQYSKNKIYTSNKKYKIVTPAQRQARDKADAEMMSYLEN